MAQAKKTSTTRGRKSTANSRNNSRKSEPMDVAIRNEIVLIALFALAVLWNCRSIWKYGQ